MTPGPDPGALPDVGRVVAEALAGVAPEHRPLAIALAERLAAERYRGWAAELGGARAVELAACAEREDDIARRVESLFPRAAGIGPELRRRHPEIEALGRALFAGRPLREQLAIQARGERAGAATWRALAERSEDPHAREAYRTCAELEERSAEALEAMLSDDEALEPCAPTST